MKTEISLTGKQHEQLYDHLLSRPGFSLALCGSYSGPGTRRLLVQEIINFNTKHGELPVEVHERIATIFEKASKKSKHVIAIFPEEKAEKGASIPPDDKYVPCTVLLMKKDRSLRGFVRDNNGNADITCIKLVGDDLHFWRVDPDKTLLPEFATRHIQLFGQGTYSRLKRLKIAVIGCSGTGSPVVEQLARLGVGHLVLVDPDYIEEKNVNRVLNSSLKAAEDRIPKVQLLKMAIEGMGLGTKVEAYREEVSNPAVVRAIAGSDVVFGCMDSVDGRHLLNRIATFYLLPYFDIGIKLIADGNGGIEQVCGTIHYLQPGGSSLLSRRAYTLEQLYAANLKRTDIEAYKEQVKSKYIEGIDEDRPAVISVNMLFGAFAVNEFLARVHPYRDDHNSEYTTIRYSLSQGVFYRENESQPCHILLPHVGRGDVCPLLDMPQLSEHVLK